MFRLRHHEVTTRGDTGARAPWVAAHFPLPGLLLLAGLLFVTPSRAGEPDPPPAEEVGDTKPTEGGKPLRFTDDDLEKFRKPRPGEAPVAEGGDAAIPQGTAPKPGAKPAPARPPSAGRQAASATLIPAPRPGPAATPATLAPPAAPVRPAAAAAPFPSSLGGTMAKPPAQDPLKPWRDREELEAFREEQLRTLRERISSLGSRLEYLNLKRLSILDPTRIMPMPQTDADRAADKARGPRDLLAIVDQEIETTETDLKQAREALINIETRFAQESGRS